MRDKYKSPYRTAYGGNKMLKTHTRAAHCIKLGYIYIDMQTPCAVITHYNAIRFLLI